MTDINTCQQTHTRTHTRHHS